MLIFSKMFKNTQATYKYAFSTQKSNKQVIFNNS